MWNAGQRDNMNSFFMLACLFIRRKQREVVNLLSLLVRWRSQSKVEVVGETKFDLRRNETKAAVSYWDEDAVNKAHVMA